MKSLSLLCTFSHGREGARPSPALFGTFLRMKLGTRASRRRAFLEIILPRHYLDTVDVEALCARLERLFGHDLVNQPKVVFDQLRALGRYDARARLPALAALPTLVVSAERDRIAPPRCGRALARAIPGAGYVELAGAGHCATVQCADEVGALLIAHLAAAESGAVGRATPVRPET